MKLDRLQDHLLPAIVLIAGIGFAMYCGTLTGHGQFGMLATIGGGIIALASLMILREQIWLLIPIFWTLTGQIPLLPLPFSIRDLVVMGVFTAFLALKALKMARRKPKLETVDYWLLALLIYLATVFVRNPVGVDALGSDRVGGRPYFNTVVACLSYWVLARVSIKGGLAKLLPFVLLASKSVEFVLNAIAFHFPQTVPVLASVYTGITPDAYDAGDLQRNPTGDTTTGRMTYLANLGTGGTLTSCAYSRPLELLNPIHFFRWLVFTLSVVCILASGYRSALLSVGIYVVLSSYFRRGTADLAKLFGIGVPLLLVLVAMQGTIVNLPLSTQRALSFLPGRWDYVAVAEAKDSTQWRVEMWKAMLVGNKYIQNKWLGDGFGLTSRQLESIRAVSGRLDKETQQEHFLIVGQVHSGPLTSIRYTGYIGLLLFLTVIGLIAWLGIRLVRRSERTDFFYLSLYLCIPVIWEPLNYIFVFGSFDNALPEAIFALGMLKMLDNSLTDYEQTKAPAIAAETGQPHLASRRGVSLSPSLR